jgi:SAM-dependent methyltransferase
MGVTMDTSGTQDDLARIKNSMRATWMAGDFGVIARSAAGAAERFVASLPLNPGMRVLDVACGTGNVAMPVAKLGCMVTGVDIAPNLLEQARERARDENVTAEFVEGDAEALPFPDGAFDAYLTMFGAMFAPQPMLVAREAARVLKPGALLAMANWNPESFTGKMFRVGSKHVPPPDGVDPPVLWGQESTAEMRLEGRFTDIETTLMLVDFDFPMKPAEVVELFKTYFGPTQMAFSRLDDEGKAAMQKDLVALWTAENKSEDPERTLVPNEFRIITARRQ